MFTTLMASSPKRRPWSMSAWGGISAGLHVLLLAGVIWFTSRPVPIEPVPHEQITYIVFAEEVPPSVDAPAEPAPPPPSEPEPPVVVAAPEPELERGFQELEIPREIPVQISPPTGFAVRALDYTGVGVRGGTGEGSVAAVDTIDAPVMLAVVDRLPQLKNTDELGPRMRALYPPLYRSAGIAGRAIVQLVVDAEGRVEPEGMSVISTTHPEFGPASMELARMIRFEPARRNGRAVRVWVQLPVDWKVD